jgi:hypothetical protein
VAGSAVEEVTCYKDKAVVHRDKLITRIMRHLAEQMKTQTHNQHETAMILTMRFAHLDIQIWPTPYVF